VRDGNHRVSVARAQGQEFIDAEVTSLSSEIPLTPNMTREEIKRAVIDFEKRRFFQSTKLDRHRPGCSLELTEVGRFDELRAHIREHKWYINLDKPQEIPFDEAAASWYDNVYLPIVNIIRESKLLSRFPGATEADLYVYIGKHWAELNVRYGPLFTLEEAAEDFSATRHSFAVLGAARSVLGRLGSLLRRR
jgi:hypothetical protein